MQENEFEKQVQQNMDDLKLDPSAAVWQKIESQIKKDKPRRSILILLPILLIGVLYGGYKFLNDNHNIENNKLNQPQSQAIESKNNIPNKNPQTNHIDSITSSHTPQAIPIASADKSPGKVQKRKVKGRLKVSTENKYTPKVNDPIAKKETTEKETTTKGTDAKIVSVEEMKTDINNTEQEKGIAKKETGSNSTIIQPEELKKLNDKDSVPNAMEIEKNKSPTEENIVSAVSKKSSTKNNKWNWGVTFTIGASGISNSFFGNLLGDDQKSTLDFNSPIGSGANQFQVAAPSKIRPALAVITGVNAERTITNRIIFTTGLNYKLFTTTNRVGADTSTSYRASNAVNKYSNRHHYLELPVAFNWQIADLKRSRLYLNTGLSISQLISAKALQFNNSTRLYYHDNSLFNKTQFGFNTGLDISFMSKEKRSIVIGPYLNYGINKIASTGYYHHHFTFIGFRSQIIFGKK